MKRILASVFVTGILFFNLNLGYAAEDLAALDSAATQALQSGKIQDAMSLYQKILKADPNYASAHMKYGQLLLTQASVMMRSQDKNSGVILREGETHIQKAIQLYENGSKPEDKIIAGNCYFMLGEVYQHVHQNLKIAATFYMAALKLDPKNAGAAQALHQLGKPV